jgi:hypothetical protein
MRSDDAPFEIEFEELPRRPQILLRLLCIPALLLHVIWIGCQPLAYALVTLLSALLCAFFFAVTLASLPVALLALHAGQPMVALKVGITGWVAGLLLVLFRHIRYSIAGG